MGVVIVVVVIVVIVVVTGGKQSQLLALALGLGWSLTIFDMKTQEPASQIVRTRVMILDVLTF